MRVLEGRLPLQRGHIEIGYTLAVIVILVAFLAMSFLSNGQPVDMWLGWPWWGKALSIVVPVVIVFGGGVFEKSRQWRKL